LIRDKAALGEKLEKETVVYVIYTVLDAVLRLMAPTVPFITEVMYQNLKEAFGLKEDSVHLLSWPKADKKAINKELELAFDISSSVVQAGLAAREKAKLSSRWPVKKVILVTNKQDVIKAVELTADIIKNQVNSKELRIVPSLPEIKKEVQPNKGKIGATFGDLSPKIIKALEKAKTEDILASFTKEGKYEINLQGKKAVITQEHVVVKRECPEHLVEAESRYGWMYLDVTREEGLVKEGYAREIMRHIQSQRKKAGMEKKDKVHLYLQVDEDLEEMLKDWKDQIQEKVGAAQLKIATKKPGKKYPHSFEGKVKGFVFKLFFERC